MKHERCRLNPNQYIAHYADKLGRLAINTALTIKHEVSPPKPDPYHDDDFRELNDFRPRNVGVMGKEIDSERSELVSLDDETAVIKDSRR